MVAAEAEYFLSARGSASRAATFAENGDATIADLHAEPAGNYSRNGSLLEEQQEPIASFPQEQKSEPKAEGSLQAEGSLKAESSSQTKAVPADQDDEYIVDPEIIEIFVEEADEVLET